jgi:TRAP transporter TAXI family solute receptor
VLSGLCVAIAAATIAWRQLTRPAVLTVAVGPAGFDDADLIGAFGRAFADGGIALRFNVVTTTGPVEALDKVAKGEAQLGVIRSDASATDRVRAVAILHTDPVVIASHDKAQIEDFGALKGKVLGVIGPPGANDALVATLRRHYGAPGGTLALPSEPAQVAAAVRERKADAVLFVAPTTRGTRIGASWAAVRRASRRNLSFIGIDDAEAIASASPAYEAGEIAAGQFGGSPPLPEESVSTILVSTYLVAGRAVSNDTVAKLARSLFEERQRIAADVPIANLMKAASTDKDAVIPIHPGAKAYFDGEETTLMERYGDWLFYGPMLLGALGSALVALMRFLGLREHQDREVILARTREYITSIEQAKTLAELDAVRTNVDNAVERLTQEALRGDLDEKRTAVIALALNYIDRLMVERRDLLRHDMAASQGRPTQLDAIRR